MTFVYKNVSNVMYVSIMMQNCFQSDELKIHYGFSHAGNIYHGRNILFIIISKTLLKSVYLVHVLLEGMYIQTYKYTAILHICVQTSVYK